MIPAADGRRRESVGVCKVDSGGEVRGHLFRVKPGEIREGV